MTTLRKAKAQLLSELAAIEEEEKAMYRDDKAKLMACHRRHQQLLEADTISAIATIVIRCLFLTEPYCGKTSVANNKDVNARRQIVIDLVRNRDYLGAMRALKKELDWSIEFAQQQANRSNRR